MGYIYPSGTTKIPSDAKEKLGLLRFYVDDGMNLLAAWSGEEDNPFFYYMNEEQELILGVQ